MTQEYFLCQNSYGNTTRFKIFYTQIFFSVTVPGPGRYPNQKLLRYDQRSFYMILGKRGNFGESKLLWEHHSIQNFLHTKIFFSYSPWPREVSKSKIVSVRSKIFQYDFLETREFWWAKTLMGIEWFEVHFQAIFSSLWGRIKKLLHIG